MRNPSDNPQDHKERTWILLLKLSLVGFFVNCQPSEPFLTKYLETEKGLAEQQLDDHVWPYDTYGSLIFLLPVGLLADSAGYWTVIFLGLVCREATRLLLLFGSGVSQMAAMQVTYAGATSVNSIYYAYVYMVVEEEDFTLATSVVIAAVHAGNTLGSLLCQVLDSSTDIGNHLQDYFYISWACTSTGLLCFILGFPAPCRPAPLSIVSAVREHGCSLIGDVVKQAYTSVDSAVWSLWWVTGGVAMPYIISNMYQTQFQNRSADGPVCLPAFFMEVLSICGALLPVKFAAVRKRRHIALACGSSAVLGALYLATTLDGSVEMSYICNSAAVAIYNCQYAFAAAAIARGTSNERYAIIFTSNQFLALGVATVVSSVGSSLHLHTDNYYNIAAVVEACLAILLCALGGWFTLHGGTEIPGIAKETDSFGDTSDGCYHSMETTRNVLCNGTEAGSLLQQPDGDVRSSSEHVVVM